MVKIYVVIKWIIILYKLGFVVLFTNIIYKNKIIIRRKNKI